jgi:hypothetical protein
VAEVFTPAAFTALVAFRAAYYDFLKSIEKASAALDLHAARGSTGERIESVRAKAATLARSRARDAFGAEADAVDALEKAGGELPTEYGSTPLELERGPLATRLGWTDEDLKRMRDATERSLDAQFNAGSALGEIRTEPSGADKHDSYE